MDDLRWLGDCRRLQLDILIVFGLQHQNYFVPPAPFDTEEARLLSDLKKRRQFYVQLLHPDSLTPFPPLQRHAQTLLQEVNQAYDFLTKSEYYRPPLSNGDMMNPFHGKFTLRDYVHEYLPHNETGAPAYLQTLLFFCDIKNVVLEQHQRIQDLQHSARMSQPISSATTNLKITPPPSPVLPVETQNDLLNRANAAEMTLGLKDIELNQQERLMEQLRGEINEQKGIISQYQSLVKRAVDDRTENQELIAQINQRLKKYLKL